MQKSLGLSLYNRSLVLLTGMSKALDAPLNFAGVVSLKKIVNSTLLDIKTWLFVEGNYFHMKIKSHQNSQKEFDINNTSFITE